MSEALHNGDTLEKGKIVYDIASRERVIRDYRCYGVLDRNKVINMIRELKQKDVDVQFVSTVKQARCGSVDLRTAPDETLIDNLDFQLKFLKIKLAKMVAENK